MQLIKSIEYVRSDPVARKPSLEGAKILVSLRLTSEVVAVIDAEVRRLKAEHPGIAPGKAEAVSVLILEALEMRRQYPPEKRKKP